MAATTQDILVGLADELDELRRAIATELLVLRTVIKAAIPYLGNDARISIDRAVRAMSDAAAATPDDPAVDFSGVVTLSLELGTHLPIHRPGWNGVPDTPPVL
jgi:hypothetical protein